MTGVAIDLRGQRFGRLVVTERVLEHGRAATGARWSCACDCGRQHEARGNVLRAGQLLSCGCWRRLSPAMRERGGPLLDLTGRRFGRLQVLALQPGTSPRAWRCRCDCGADTVVRTGLLLSNNTKSCGCGQQRRGA